MSSSAFLLITWPNRVQGKQPHPLKINEGCLERWDASLPKDEELLDPDESRSMQLRFQVFKIQHPSERSFVRTSHSCTLGHTHIHNQPKLHFSPFCLQCLIHYVGT